MKSTDLLEEALKCEKDARLVDAKKIYLQLIQHYSQDPVNYWYFANMLANNQLYVDALAVINQAYAAILPTKFDVGFKSSLLRFGWGIRDLRALEDSIRCMKIGTLAKSFPDIFHLFYSEKSDANKSIPVECMPGSNDNSLFNKNGILLGDPILTPDQCADLLALSSRHEGRAFLDIKISDFLFDTGIISKILDRSNQLSCSRTILWNAISLRKERADKDPSDQWHLDNHYHSGTFKLMIYLDEQSSKNGATLFASKDFSRLFSRDTGYLGLLFQRPQYSTYASKAVDKSMLCQSTLEPLDISVFCPKESGLGVWFYPSNVFHKGVGPSSGNRPVLSLSFVSVPNDSTLISDSITISRMILEDKIAQSKIFEDNVPVWSSLAFPT